MAGKLNFTNKKVNEFNQNQVSHWKLKFPASNSDLTGSFFWFWFSSTSVYLWVTVSALWASADNTRAPSGDKNSLSVCSSSEHPHPSLKKLIYSRSCRCSSLWRCVVQHESCWLDSQQDQWVHRWSLQSTTVVLNWSSSRTTIILNDEPRPKSRNIYNFSNILNEKIVQFELEIVE